MIEKKFAFHEPTAHGRNFADSVRAYVSELYRHISMVVPDSREKSIALTKLEEVSMWAIKGIVINDPASKVVTNQDVQQTMGISCGSLEANKAMAKVDCEMKGEKNCSTDGEGQPVPNGEDEAAKPAEHM